MRKTLILYIPIITLLVFILGIVIFIPDSSLSSGNRFDECAEYKNGWTLTTQTTTTTHKVLPDFLHTNNERDVYIHRTLTNITEDDYLGFFSFQQQVRVYIDETEIYNFVPTESENSLTPGNKWNLIPLLTEYNNHHIWIHIHQCYSANRISIPTFYYGTQLGIATRYLKAEVIHLLISIIMILFGIFICIFSLLSKNTNPLTKGLKWLALFAIFRGAWTFIEANIYSLFFTRLLLFSHVSYLCLKIAVTTFLQFMNCTFHNNQNKVIKFLTWASLADFFISFILQLIFSIDYAKTVFLTHIILFSGGIYSCCSSFKILHSYNTNIGLRINQKRNSTYLIQIGCNIAIITASLADLIRYYTVNSPDIAKYSRWGDLLYISIMFLTFFFDFIYLLKLGNKAVQIQEEASHDPMTKLRNRSAFERDISKGSIKDWTRQSIVLLDLNNLKYFNDIHGHGMGDYYIIIASEMINDAFMMWGVAYRIGGDEFCIIASNLTEDKFIEVRTALETRIKSLKLPNADLHMGISAGYAAFDAKLDNSLRDTMKRADEFMYKRKSQLKENITNKMDSQ